MLCRQMCQSHRTSMLLQLLEHTRRCMLHPLRLATPLQLQLLLLLLRWWLLQQGCPAGLLAGPLQRLPAPVLVSGFSSSA